MADNIKALYTISQKDIYSVMETAWDNFNLHQSEFEAFKGFYKVPYSTDAKNEISIAKAMPDNEARSSIAETLRITLKEKGTICLNNFQRLKRYITTSFPHKEMHKPQFEAAGDNYYFDAGNDDWESMVLLNQSGINYITLNSILLTSGDNMPATFENNFTNSKDEFDDVYSQFKLAEQTSEETANKIKANNACFVKCMDMLKDGQIIFANQADVKSKFVFQTLVDLINPSMSGIKGIIKDSISFEGLASVNIDAQKSGQPVQNTITNDEGKYSLQLAEGNYTVIISATNYVTQTMSVDITKGNFKALDVILIKNI